MSDNDDPISTYFREGCKGDRRAMEKLLERHLDWIERFAHRKLSPLLRAKTETGDIVQDALVQFLRHGPRFTISNDRQLRALLARIVENVLHDKYDWFTALRRTVAKERPLPPDTVLNLAPSEGTGRTPSQIVHKNEQEAWVRLGLELLEPEDRRVLILRDWDGLTYIEIGEQLKVSEFAARRRYLRSLGLLAKTVKFLRAGQIDKALENEGKESDR